MLPGAIYTFNTIPIRIPSAFFSELVQIILRFVWNQETRQIAKGMSKKETKAGGITIPDFKLYDKAVIIKTVWYRHKNRHTGQWNRIESPEMDPQLYGQLICDKAGKNVQWNKRQSFQQMVLGKLDNHK